MDEQKKTHAPGATGNVGLDSVSTLDIKPIAPGHASDDAQEALRGALWHSIQKAALSVYKVGGMDHGKLVSLAKGQGFTASEARHAISSLVANGFAHYALSDGHGRVIVCPVDNQGGVE